MVKPVIVVVVPVPVAVPEGVPVTVQLPEAGNPLSATLPVAIIQVGCVIVPIIGALGAEFIVAKTAVLDAVVQPPFVAST